MTDTRDLATSVGCSIVVEAYNLTEGQSWALLDRAAQAAKVAARHAPNGPHEVLLVTTD